MTTGMSMRSAVVTTVYQKSLRLSNASRQSTTTGNIVNLMTVDAQRFMDLMMYFHLIWSAPLQIALSMYFLWGVVGVSSLAGLAVMILMIPLNGVIAKKFKGLQIQQMKQKDARIKEMNEVCPLFFIPDFLNGLAYSGRSPVQLCTIRLLMLIVCLTSPGPQRN